MYHFPCTGIMIPGYRYRASYKIISLTLYIVLDILLFSPHHANYGLTATASCVLLSVGRSIAGRPMKPHQPGNMMPTRPSRFCSVPSCPNKAVAGSTRCAAHAIPINRDHDSRRGNANERGYTKRWSRVRTAYLHDHPLCETCKAAGILTPATVVDHIVPHRGDHALFWDRENWQSLCRKCHNVKTATEDGGFGNERISANASAAMW